MEEIQTNSWTEFQDALTSVRKKYLVYRRELADGKSYDRRNMILFRGQSNYEWKLSTTLERKTSEKFNVLSYLALARRTKFEIESITGRQWNVPEHQQLLEDLKKNTDGFPVQLPAYEYLVYLRHHGYPSPLLDWTESPYIAAYFAYLDATTTDCAVFCYIERPTGVKGGSGGDPWISVLGPFVSTDKRHFAQKAWYTIATRWDYRENRHEFCSHEDAFSLGVSVAVNFVRIGRFGIHGENEGCVE